MISLLPSSEILLPFILSAATLQFKRLPRAPVRTSARLENAWDAYSLRGGVS